MRNPEYIGDGVYAHHLGYAIELRANDYNNPSDRIVLELEVFDSLLKFKESTEKGFYLSNKKNGNAWQKG